MKVPLGQENVRLRAENEGLIREIENLRAIALTASEAEWLYDVVVVAATKIAQLNHLQAMVKLRCIAPPEPREWSNG